MTTKDIKPDYTPKVMEKVALKKELEFMSEYNPNQPEFYHNIAKGSIVKEGIFERFPELIPAVGEHIGERTGYTRKCFLSEEASISITMIFFSATFLMPKSGICLLMLS